MSSLMAGCFGIDFVNAETGKSHMFSVFSELNEVSLPGILFHEYSHPFINPLTEKYYNLAVKYENACQKLKKHKLPDYKSGYGDFSECINEHFVRAMAIHLLKKIGLNDIAIAFLENDLRLGYMFVPEILKRYEFYDLHRDFFSDFEEFYPELIKVFGMEIDNE